MKPKFKCVECRILSSHLNDDGLCPACAARRLQQDQPENNYAHYHH